MFAAPPGIPGSRHVPSQMQCSSLPVRIVHNALGLPACVLQVWAVPTTMMQCDWLGERVATVDVDR